MRASHRSLISAAATLALCWAAGTIACAQPPPEQARAEYGAGVEAENAGRLEEARAHFETALRLAQQAAPPDAPGALWQQAACLESLGGVLGKLGQTPEALTALQQALDLYGRLEGTQWERANCLCRLGALWGQRGDDAREAELVTQALALYRQVAGTQAEQAGCLVTLAVRSGEIGEDQQAASQLQEALALYQALPDAALGQAACYQDLGVAYGRLGAWDEGLAATARALELYGTDPATEGARAECLQNLGTAYASLGRYGLATAATGVARDLYARLAGTEGKQAECLANLAVMYGAVGDADNEVRSDEQALAHYRAGAGSPLDTADCLTNLGVALLAADRPAGALTRLSDAERVYRQAARGLAGAAGHWAPESLYKDQAALAKALRTGQGDLSAAYRHLARAAVLVERVRGAGTTVPEWRASRFAQMSWVYDEMCDLLLQMRERGMPLDPTRLEERDPGFWSDLGLPVPRLWRGWASVEEAFLHYSEAARARVLWDLLSSARGVAGAGEGYAQWESVSALASREQQLAEQVRLAAAAGQTDRLAGLQAALDEATQERQRAEMRWADSSFGTVATAEPAGLPEVRRLIGSAARALGPTAVLEYKVLPRGLLICLLTADGARLYRVTGPEATTGEPLSRLDEMRRAAAEAAGLPQGAKGTVGVDALLGAFGVEELVWLYRYPMTLLGRGGERPQLEALDWREQQLYVAVALYRLLLAPVEGALASGGIKHLLIVPDGALCYLPFEGLAARLPQGVAETPAGQVFAAPGVEYAVERWSLSYLPSVSMYGAAQRLAAGRPAPTRRLCAFADPAPAGTPEGPLRGGALVRLPETRHEAERSLAAFAAQTRRPAELFEDPAKVRWAEHVGLVSAAAAEPLAYAPELADYGYVLFATHGVIDPVQGLHSYLALAPAAGAGDATPHQADGRLLLPEVFGLHLNARMVTLSACQTGEGQLSRGEGVLGLTAAFFSSGAQAVTASLWAVADEATADLMAGYHTGLAAGESPAQALRQARLDMLQQGRAAFAADPSSPEASRAHPYYWSSFELLGL